MQDALMKRLFAPLFLLMGAIERVLKKQALDEDVRDVLDLLHRSMRAAYAELKREVHEGYPDGGKVYHPVCNPATEADKHFLQEVRDTIETHLGDAQFNVGTLCRALAMSHSQMHRRLSAITGVSATYYIRYIRLSKAKEMLSGTDLSINDIAFDCGFTDPSYFGRVFKQTFGLSPHAWRNPQKNT